MLDANTVRFQFHFFKSDAVIQRKHSDRVAGDSIVNAARTILILLALTGSIQLIVAAKIAANYWQGTLHFFQEHYLMSVRTYSLPKIDVSDARFERPWNVDMEAFFSFSFEMSERLLDLEARHLSPSPVDEEFYSAAAAQATWM